MKETGNFDKVMAEIRQEHREVEAPRHLELLLRTETERKAAAMQRVPPNRRALAWGLSVALLASILLGAVAWEMNRTRELKAPKVQAVQHVAPALNPVQQSTSPDLPSPKRQDVLAPVRYSRPRSVRRGSHADASGADVEQASMGEFVALPASEGLAPSSAISLVRMQIEQSALQQYGLEVPAEAAPRTLLAEFVVGEDGLPRAIRIVR